MSNLARLTRAAAALLAAKADLRRGEIGRALADIDDALLDVKAEEADARRTPVPQSGTR